MDMSDRIESNRNVDLYNTTFTLDWIENKLKAALKIDDANFGSETTIERIAIGQGFMSIMLRLHVDWKYSTTTSNCQPSLPSNFIIKIPTTETMLSVSERMNMEEHIIKNGGDDTFEMDKQMIVFEKLIKSFHSCEISFYQLLIDDQRLHIPSPKCYFYHPYSSDDQQSKGLLILEDMSKSAGIKPLYESLSLKSVENVLDVLADLHAYSLTNRNWLENKNFCNSMSVVQAYSDDNDDQSNSTNSFLLSIPAMLHAQDAQLFGNLIDRLRDEVLNEKFDMRAADQLADDMGMPSVLTHGDLWLNNILWKKDEQGKLSDELAAIIDFQLIHPGCIGEDFVRFFTSSLDAEFRRNNTERLLQYYFNVMQKKFANQALPFTFEQTKVDYNFYFPSNIFSFSITTAYQRSFNTGAAMVLPMLGTFVSKEMGDYGIVNDDEHRKVVLNRCKSLIEDMLEMAKK